MELRFLTSARNDLAALRDHYRQTLPPGSRIGQMHLSEALTLLKRNPEAGLPLPSPKGVRALSIPFLPFALIYRVSGTRVEFLRVCRLGQSGTP
jgi:hypothetical protein